jgi:branched-chain amino acid transport system permease protein
VEVVAGGANADPAAVAFDAAEAALSRGVDVLLIDTAGRLHTQDHLMRQLTKVRDVVRRKIPDAPHEVLLVLVTYAMFLMLEDITKLIWGANPYYVSEPYALFGNIDIGHQSYVGYDLFLVLLALLVGAVVWWCLNRTRTGKIVTAVIHSPEIASSMGVNVSRVYMGAFVAGIFLAALGGAFTAPMISVQPGVSVGVIIISFAVVIIGGLGSIEGAAIGALIVGLARACAVHLMPVAELFSVYLVMALVLVFRPQGLFQRIQARKI